MSYYSAGGYYGRGGFSFKKLTHWVGHVASVAVHNPIIQGAIGLIPGGGTVLSGLQVADQVSAAVSVPHAIATSNPGTPGMTAAVSAGVATGRKRRARKPRRRRAWVYG